MRRLIAALLMGLTVAGCSQPARSTAEPAPSPAASVPASSPPPSQPSRSPSAGTGCLSSELDIEAVTGPGNVSHQPRVRLVLTNGADRPCTLANQPEVRLIGANHPIHGPTYQLGRADRAYPDVTLARGGSAYVTVAYLSDAPGRADRFLWLPERITLTLSAPGGVLVVRWPGQLVSRDDLSMYPGTYSGPFMPGRSGPFSTDRK